MCTYIRVRGYRCGALGREALRDVERTYVPNHARFVACLIEPVAIGLVHGGIIVTSTGEKGHSRACQYTLVGPQQLAICHGHSCCSGMRASLLSRMSFRMLRPCTPWRPVNLAVAEPGVEVQDKVEVLKAPQTVRLATGPAVPQRRSRSPKCSASQRAGSDWSPCAAVVVLRTKRVDCAVPCQLTSTLRSA